MAIAGMEQGLSDTNQAPLKLPAASMPMPVGMMPPNMTALSRPVPAMGAPGMPAMPAMPMSSMPMSQPLLMQPIFNQQNFMMQPVGAKLPAAAPSLKRDLPEDGNDSDMSDDTAEVDSNSEGT